MEMLSFGEGDQSWPIPFREAFVLREARPMAAYKQDPDVH